MYLPDSSLLTQTNDVDYYHWNYRFPIRYIQRFRFQAILRMLGSNRVGTLLEAGTGSGIFLPELSGHCHELHACDVHRNMDQVAEMCRRTNTQATLKTCPLECTGYPDQMFDVVVAVSVLEFVSNLDLSLDEIQRILKPGGVFLTICPHQSPMLDAVLKLYTRRAPGEEFGDSRSRVRPALESRFQVLEKHVFPGILGHVLPVYHYYKLQPPNRIASESGSGLPTGRTSP